MPTMKNREVDASRAFDDQSAPTVAQDKARMKKQVQAKTKKPVKNAK